MIPPEDKDYIRLILAAVSMHAQMVRGTEYPGVIAIRAFDVADAMLRQEAVGALPPIPDESPSCDIPF